MHKITLQRSCPSACCISRTDSTVLALGIHTESYRENIILCVSVDYNPFFTPSSEFSTWQKYQFNYVKTTFIWNMFSILWIFNDIQRKIICLCVVRVDWQQWGCIHNKWTSVIGSFKVTLDWDMHNGKNVFRKYESLIEVQFSTFVSSPEFCNH